MSFDVDVSSARGGGVHAAFATGAGITVLVGASGIGKSSILDMIAGLLRPDRGHVRVGGRALFDSRLDINLPPERRNVGYVFQDARLFPHQRVRGNMLYGARDAHALAGIADTLGIAHLLSRWPRTLSGGEARRVAIGRALLRDPDFLLLDEPMSSLDPRRREETAAMIVDVQARLGLPVLLVTHDMDEARRLGDAIVSLG